MRVKSRKPGRRVFYNLGLDVIFEVGRGTHDRVGNQVRQMGCDRQNLIVVRGFQVVDLATCLLPQRRNLVDCGLIGAWRWRDQKPTSLEQCFEPGLGSGIFGARDRVTWDKNDPFGQVRHYRGHSGFLDGSRLSGLHQVSARAPSPPLLRRMSKPVCRSSPDPRLERPPQCPWWFHPLYSDAWRHPAFRLSERMR